MGFASAGDVMHAAELVSIAAVRACLDALPQRAAALEVPKSPFARLAHADAMQRFGVDKVEK